MSATARKSAVSGFEAVTLDNARIRAVVVPSLGGRLWELTDLGRDRQWLWHREGVALAAASPGSVYDEVWAGGWEELFPNDAPGRFGGRELLDHGEWWTAPWSVAEVSDGAEAVVRLVTETRLTRARCSKEYRLGSGADTLYVSYGVESLEPEPFHYLFKVHLPIALTPACRLAAPGGRVTAVDPAFGTLLPGPGPYSWPFARGMRGAEADLRRVPEPSSGAREFVYVSDLPAGWCGVDDVQRGAAFRLRFDLGDLPFLWLFLAYGGWRGCYTAVLEPCTNMPKDLAEAVRSGRSASLVPGGRFETRVAVTLGGLGALP